MATNGIDATTGALILAAMNGGTALAITSPLRTLFHSTMRTVDNGTDTEITTSAGYVQKAGSLFSGTALTFAAATTGVGGAAQNSNSIASVTNMPASTWAGNTIVDSKATPRNTSADGVTNGTTTITSASAAFVAGDVGAIVTGTNMGTNNVIASVTNGTTAVMAQAASGSGSSIVFTINKLVGQQTTFWATLGSSKTVNAGDTVTVPSGSWQTTLA